MTLITRRLATCVGICFLFSAEAQAGTLRTVALTGQPAPGTPPGAVFFGFARLPVLNNAGRVAFVGSLTGDGVDDTNNIGLWSEASGTMSLVARTGSHAVGTPDGVNFRGGIFPVFIPLLNSAGQTAFVGYFNGPGVTELNDSAIWTENAGSVTHILREGTQAVGAPPGVNFGGIDYFAFNEFLQNPAGDLVFVADLTGVNLNPPVAEGIWAVRNGALSMIAREGQRAPGTPSGITFGYHSGNPNVVVFRQLSLNDAGQAAFIASLRGAGEGTNQGIWLADATSTELVLRAGSQAHGMPDGVNFGSFAGLSQNSAGHIAFISALTGTGVGLSNDYGIWSNRDGSFELVVREGDPAPGAPPGAVFSNFTSEMMLLGANDKISIVAAVSGPGIDRGNNAGLWVERGNELVLVARESTPAPGTPFGVNFNDFGSHTFPVFNANGQVAFHGWLIGAGVTNANDRGLWATDIHGQLKLIAREGDQLEVAPGDFRTISFINYIGRSNNDDGRNSGFNGLGQLAFEATFADGTAGIFVSSFVAVPEPSAIALMALASLAWRLRHRQAHGRSAQLHCTPNELRPEGRPSFLSRKPQEIPLAAPRRTGSICSRGR